MLSKRGEAMRSVRFLERLTEGVDLPGEPLPGQTIVEIAGDRRVLIENHAGVKQYSMEKIGVCADFGTVCITGCKLELKQMTKERLVIAGHIDSVNLIRRDER